MPNGRVTSISDEVRALLGRENTLVLATTLDDGTPAATPLFYYFDGEAALYWLSSPESRHSRNLAARPRVAVAVYAAVRDWREIRGVQMEGVAEPVTDDAVLARYRERHGLGQELDAAIARSTMYVFRVAWWRYVDGLGEQAAPHRL